MSITSFECWYRDLKGKNLFVSRGNWEINRADLEYLQDLGDDQLDRLLETMEAHPVLKSDLLKALYPPNKIRVIGKSQTSYLFNTKMAHEYAWTYSIMSSEEAKNFEDSVRDRRLAQAWIEPLEPILRPLSELLQWAAGLLGYNLTSEGT